MRNGQELIEILTVQFVIKPWVEETQTQEFSTYFYIVQLSIKRSYTHCSTLTSQRFWEVVEIFTFLLQRSRNLRSKGWILANGWSLDHELDIDEFKYKPQLLSGVKVTSWTVIECRLGRKIESYQICSVWTMNWTAFVCCLKHELNDLMWCILLR